MENAIEFDTKHQEEVNQINTEIQEYVREVVGSNPLTIDVLQKIVYHVKNNIVNKCNCDAVIIGLHLNTQRETFDPMEGITMTVSLSFKDSTTQNTCFIGIKPKS